MIDTMKFNEKIRQMQETIAAVDAQLEAAKYTLAEIDKFFKEVLEQK